MGERNEITCPFVELGKTRTRLSLLHISADRSKHLFEGSRALDFPINVPIFSHMHISSASGRLFFSSS